MQGRGSAGDRCGSRERLRSFRLEAACSRVHCVLCTYGLCWQLGNRRGGFAERPVLRITDSAFNMGSARSVAQGWGPTRPVDELGGKVGHEQYTRCSTKCREGWIPDRGGCHLWMPEAPIRFLQSRYLHQDPRRWVVCDVTGDGQQRSQACLRELWAASVGERGRLCGRTRADSAGLAALTMASDGHTARHPRQRRGAVSSSVACGLPFVCRGAVAQCFFSMSISHQIR